MAKLQHNLARLCWTVAIAVSVLFYAAFGREGYNFYGDALGYYTYLPATFIYHNHKSIERLPQDRGIRPFIHGYMAQIGGGQRTPKGYVLNQYTYGVALMELPFFAAAHLFELARGSLANGFSTSYRLAIDISSMVCGALGLLLTYRVLRRHFPPHIASITTALLLIGTNLFWFCLRQQGMAHVPLFFLFALLLELTAIVHERGRWYHFAALGCTAGLITIIRPVDGLCVLIPLLYVGSKPFFRTKIEFLHAHWRQISLACICFLLPVIPQMLYWNWLTGYNIYDSYGPAQTFDFRHPHLWRGIFGASNGWLVYTPLVLAALAGFFLRKTRTIPFFTGSLLLMLGYVWMVYAWYLPNYPNGLGSRPMVDVYPVLAFPLAGFIDGIWNARWIKWPAIAAIIACIFINIQYSIKETTSSLWSEDSKLSFNLNTFFRYKLRYDDLVLWDLGVPQPQRLQSTGKPYTIDFRDSALSAHVGSDSVGGKYYSIKEGEEYSPVVLTVPLTALSGGNAGWLRCSGRFRVSAPVLDIYKNHLLVVELHRGDSLLAWHGLRINNKVGLLEPQHKGDEPQLFSFRDTQWGTVSCFVPLPAYVKPGDYIKMFVWNIGKTPIDISGLSIAGAVAKYKGRRLIRLPFYTRSF